MSVFAIIGQLLVGWLIADMLTGLLHWLEDRVLTETMPIIGTTVVAPNRQHHRDPTAFMQKTFLQRNGTTWITVAIVGAIWAALWGVSLVWAAALVGGASASIVHYYTHKPTTGLLRVLQETGLIQSVRQHAQHHKPNANRRYCTLTDFLNPFLDHFEVWAKLERLLGKLGVKVGD